MKVFQFLVKLRFVTIWDGLGPHFKRFLGTLGDILVVLEGPGTRVEFQWILRPCLGPPLGASTGGGRGEISVPGAQHDPFHIESVN